MESPQNPSDWPAPDAAAGAAAPQDPVELAARLAEMSDAYLRAKAEVENTRRRAEEEVSKARKFAVESFAESLLPVKDSLEAALSSRAQQVGSEASGDATWQGVEATLKQLTSALERHRVMEINPPLGTRFDPHQHQAISVVSAPAGTSVDPNCVVTVLQKGYLIAERVLRPALVTVSAPQ